METKNQNQPATSAAPEDEGGSAATIGSARNELTLKWGTLKGWDLKTPEAVALLKKYYTEPVQYSVMMQRDTPNQKEILLALIDLCDDITLDWEGKQVSHDEAKEYIRTYGQNGESSHERSADAKR